jgi:uncharacterized protein involved in response to NO
MQSLHTIAEPWTPPPAGRFALWDLGFRPFYLLAAGFAALSVPLWALQFAGVLGLPLADGPLWHAHEMVFGFALAGIVGFLFTAARNWSGQPTPHGRALVALALLWLAGRALAFTPWHAVTAVVQLAFPLAAAAGLALPLWRARQRRNYFFVGLLVLMALASTPMHLARLGVVDAPARTGLQCALDLVLFIVAVMGGRVIPMFTNNGVPGAAARREPWLEKAALGSVLVLLVADAAGLSGAPLALVALAAALAHARRWALWQPWTTTRAPLLWVLHLAYAWVPIHLALRAAGEIGWVAPSAATHALTVGAIGGLIIGMITRTALGHTGRPLRAGRTEVACYGLVLGAAALRVLLPLAAPALTLFAIQASAALWAAGFGLYAWRYGPILLRERLDARPRRAPPR